MGIERDICDGFMFIREKGEQLDGIYSDQALCVKSLLRNRLAYNCRLEDISLLDVAINTGVEAEACGEYYHPAVNKELDELSGVKTSLWQIQSLLEKIHVANKITEPN